MILDDHLTFEDHVKYEHKKSSKKLSILCKSREFLDGSTSLLLYKSLIVPYIDYCELVYMHTNAANLDKLQKIQNSACWTILEVDNGTSIKYMHKELDLMTLSERCHQHLSIE